ncbi:G2/M phase-specific E3 ubiquitin-protein ligase [Takifugu flavidus]|uniref:G2/M phase-specific E3 ubiquitin-protein ligase n=1 Tax=Takifugu flavidus TaxID=433684 RepID=A0A5C6MEY2_9TELE|nr:G2/M phase-specific E3 ubiquitin-protein ligase [Takifugu flavidus]
MIGAPRGPAFRLRDQSEGFPVYTSLPQTEEPAVPGTSQATVSQQPVNVKRTDKHLPSYKQFLDYRNSKSNERQSYSYGGRHRAKERKHVQIIHGTMVRHETFLKPLRGRTLPLFVDPDIEAPDILSKAVQKMRTFRQDTPEGTYVLLYPDCSEIDSRRPYARPSYWARMIGAPRGPAFRLRDQSEGFPVYTSLPQTEEPAVPGTSQATVSQQPVNVKRTDKHLPSYKQFLDYRNSKSNERQSYSYGGRHRAKERKHVQINIGTMVRHETFLKPLRGRTLPLFVDPDIEAPDILSKAVQKMRTFHQDTPEGTYVLLYPDCSEVIHVPGSERPFKLAEYKQELGRPYSRITFFICLERHFQAVESDSDSEIVLTSRSSAEFNQADTVVFEPQNQSTPQNIPEHERDAPGHSSTIQPGQIVISDGESMDGPEANPATTSCYSNYTDLYAPDVEDMDEDLVAVDVENLEHTAVEEMNITLPDIVANLSLPIDHKRVSRFNLSRANVWDGAVRGFKRTTYTEQCDMLVRFTDDAGFFEEGIDTGGPRREFLTLLMRHLKDRPIFDGPDGHRFLVYNAKAVREDEYFIAGKMIAVSVVHGGPGPHFLSEDLVQYLAGRPSFKSTVDAITDEEIRTVLREIENAASLDALQECIMRHSTVFQTAGCLRHLTSVEEKKDLVADYVR